MRLISIQTLELKDFLGRPPPYAILSHRWGKEELSYQDFQDPAKRHGEGFENIMAFCAIVQATYSVCHWVWVDTCCIDKTSSAELSEAINSMWKYYCNAQACIAYLVDVWEGIDSTQFRNSTWFKRGWTLQELLAPGEVRFYNHDWRCIGSKRYQTCHVADASLIDREFLAKSGNISDASIAQRMSWASDQITTRGEDIAYCLMGLFDVNIPPLYPEGEQKAFLRLRKEIIQQSNDESVFAFAGSLSSGALAAHPARFRRSGHIRKQSLVTRSPYGITHRGLRFEAPAIYYRKDPEPVTQSRPPVDSDDDSTGWQDSEAHYIIKLNCVRWLDPLEGPRRKVAQSCLMTVRREEEDTFVRSWDLENKLMKMTTEEVSSNFQSGTWQKCESQVFFIRRSGEDYTGRSNGERYNDAEQKHPMCRDASNP